MAPRPGAYPHGYRNFLYMTNHSRRANLCMRAQTPSKQLIRELAEHPQCVPVDPLRFERRAGANEGRHG